MCGRFVQSWEPDDYGAAFAVDRIVTEKLPASYNVAPTDPVYVVTAHRGERLLDSFRWGLVPFWAKDRKLASRNINARVESVATKPAFRESFATRRCMIPADGFYEWKVMPKGKLPHYVHRADGAPLALAGLWASWRHPDTGERLRTCTIVTGDAGDLIADLHDRMPLTVRPDDWAAWLDGDFDDTDALLALLAAAPVPGVAIHPVSTLVNSVANNVPELIEPLEAPPSIQLELG